MAFSTKKLSKEFRRAAAITLMAIAPFAMTGCDKHDKQAKDDTQTTVATVTAQFVENGKSICLYGCPTGAPEGNHVIERSIYVLSNNPDTKFADWVGYVVSTETIGTTQRRVWHVDPDLLPTETLSPKDYKGIRDALQMDRGHQAPLASLTGMPDWAMADYLSNITPQTIDLNEGAWEDLERAERKLAKGQAIVVHSITGTLYERDMPKLPNSHLDHKVPSGYWKIVTVLKDNHLHTAAFIMEQNTPRQADPCDYAVTIQVIETRSHLHFFPKLDKAEDEKIIQSKGDLLPDLGCKTAPAPGPR
jgi:endonuclease G